MVWESRSLAGHHSIAEPNAIGIREPRSHAPDDDGLHTYHGSSRNQPKSSLFTNLPITINHFRNIKSKPTFSHLYYPRVRQLYRLAPLCNVRVARLNMCSIVCRLFVPQASSITAHALSARPVYSLASRRHRRQWNVADSKKRGPPTPSPLYKPPLSASA